MHDAVPALLQNYPGAGACDLLVLLSQVPVGPAEYMGAGCSMLMSWAQDELKALDV